MVVSVGHRLGEGQGEGNGNVIGVRLVVSHGGGGRRGKQKAGQAAQVGRNGVERVRMNGHEGNLDNILHRIESSDWVAAVLVLEKPPNNEHAIWSR